MNKLFIFNSFSEQKSSKIVLTSFLDPSSYFYWDYFNNDITNKSCKTNIHESLKVTAVSRKYPG